MDKVITAQPKHSTELLTAVESTLRHHNLRLKPGQTLADVVEVLESEQVKLSADHGYLNATMGGQPAHVNTVVEALATKHADRFFPRAVDNITSRDQLDTEGKLRFIRERGIREWEKLPPSAPKNTTVVLDPMRLKRVEWLSLDRATRAQLSAQWGPDVVGRIMGRKK